MPLLIKIRSLGVELKANNYRALIADFLVNRTLIDKIQLIQALDPSLMKLKEDVQKSL